MLLSFANLWQQQELSDVTLVLQALPDPRSSSDASNSVPLKPSMLRTLPAHKVILSASDYFKAQVQAWQQQSSTTVTTLTHYRQPGSSRAARHLFPPRTTGSSSSTTTTATSLPVITLTLASAQEKPAAISILEAMYGVKPVAQILIDSSCTHKLDIAVLADMLHIPGITAPTVNSLLEACKGSSACAAAVGQHLSSKSHIPSCLLPVVKQLFLSFDSSRVSFQLSVVQQILLAVLGDLEAVWADEGLKVLMMDLPSSVMLLLLDMDGFQVTSEDTVLFTAAAYIRHKLSYIPNASQRKAALSQLACLIRCPHLSRFWLTAAVANKGHGSQQFLEDLHQHLVALASLQLAGPLHCAVAATPLLAAPVSRSGSYGGSNSGSIVPALQQASEVQQLLQECPPSWHRGPRVIKALAGGVDVQWKVRMEDLVRFCREGFIKASAGQVVNSMLSENSSAPIGGMAWRPRFELLNDLEGGVLLGLFAGPVDAPANMFYKFSYNLTCQGVARNGTSGFTKDSRSCGWADFFDLGPMAGGWDEAAWAAKGLPATGEVMVQLVVCSVGHV